MTAPDRTSKLSKFQLAQMGVSIHDPVGQFSAAINTFAIYFIIRHVFDLK